MLSKHFQPIEANGCKFDRGMILFEFDAFREPEKTQFAKIGEWVKERIEMVEIPTPQMLWRGKFAPDPFIANQLSGVPADVDFHETFIEPMCRKISGRSYSEMERKYHRALWLPEYWPETLRARQSLRTPFWYPRCGYAGSIIDCVQQLGKDAGVHGNRPNDSSNETSGISLAFLLAKPRHDFSVLFVVDQSPIYRVTDQDVCAGIETEWHRLVVEYQSQDPIGVVHELTRLGLISDVRWVSFHRMKMPIPTITNVLNGWKPAPHMNAQLWEVMNDA